MPKGWTLADNSWARYFNTLVNSIDGGIDPNGIVFFETNKSVSQTFNVGLMELLYLMLKSYNKNL